MFTLIRFTQVNRKTRETRPCWLETARFADGPGMRVKNMTVTADRSKAMRFSSLENAHAVAVQFSNNPAMLETGMGTLLVEETKKLLTAQAARHEELKQLARDFDEALREAFSHSGINIVELIAKA